MARADRSDTRYRRTALVCLIGVAMVACSGEPVPAPSVPPQLVNLEEVEPRIVVDLRYATTNNFLGAVLYPDARVFLLDATARRLASVQDRLDDLGFGLKIYDGFRPLAVQRRMWAAVPDERYVADPAKGSMHNRGCAVDVTLVTSTGEGVIMPSDYDDFSERAHRDFGELSEEAARHRTVLEKAMVAEGFVPLATEWWHFDDFGCADRPLVESNPYERPIERN